jgi:aspartate-semialdehyde dehydrogenase
LPVHAMDDIDVAASRCRILFSAVASDVAAAFEERYAAAGLAVVSNASHHRATPDVPVIIPELNADHLHIIPEQRRSRGWTAGCLVAKPNCSLQSYLLPLFPLHQRYRLTEVAVTTLQAISGAGYPGPSAATMVDNIIPYIAGEEEKAEREPLKILGDYRTGTVRIVPATGIRIAAQCNRVPVTDGHLAIVSARFQQPPTLDEVAQVWAEFRGAPQLMDLPSAPAQPIQHLLETDRPQPRLDREAAQGMAVTVGRLRACPLFHCRFVGLSHNVIRGAAGGAILIAELLVKTHLVTDFA